MDMEHSSVRKLAKRALAHVVANTMIVIRYPKKDHIESLKCLLFKATVEKLIDFLHSLNSFSSILAIFSSFQQVDSLQQLLKLGNPLEVLSPMS